MQIGLCHIFITVTAGLFAMHTRDAKEIASLLNTTEQNIHRWMEREKWEEVLQPLGYAGEQNFRVKLREKETARATIPL